MTNRMILIAMLPLLMVGCGSGDAPSQRDVYIVRHGEKEPHDTSYIDLNNIGMMRAWALVPYLKTTLPIYKDINTIYADPNVDGYSGRPMETCQPLAYSKGMTLDTSYTVAQSNALGQYLAQNSNLGGTIFICWEHDNIVHIVEGLGVPRSEIPHWKSGNFDTVYHITLNADGTVKSFEHFLQNLPSNFDMKNVAFSTTYFNPNAISALTTAMRTQLNISCVGASADINASCTANWNTISCCDDLLYQSETSSDCSSNECNTLYGTSE